MTEGQTDIGFDRGQNKWFLKFYTKNRWEIGQIMIDKANLKLQNVECDTYSWVEQNDANDSHGRLRYYNSSRTVITGAPTAEGIEVTGTGRTMQLVKLHGKTVIIQYIRNGMMWEIDIDGKKYITRNIIGNITAQFTDEPIRMVLTDVTVLYSSLAALVNADIVEDIT